MKIIIFEGATKEEMGNAMNELKTHGFLFMNTMPKIIELTETERIKMGDLEIERPVEKDPLDEIFVEKHKQKELPKREKRKYTKKKKGRNSHVPRTQVKYTDEIVERVKEVVNKKTNQEIRDLLQSEFGLNVSVPCVSNMMSTRGIKRKNILKIKIPEFSKPTPKYKTPEQRTKESKRKGMSEEAIEIIEENYMEKTDEELREIIAEEIGAYHQVDKIESYRETNGMARPLGWNPEDYSEEDN